MYSDQPYKRCFRKASGLARASFSSSQVPACQVLKGKAAYLFEHRG